MAAADFTAGLFKLQFKALGTNCEVQFRAPSVAAAREYRTTALTWIKEFEQTWSRFKADSLLCKINAAAGERAIELTPEQDHIISLCQHTWETSNGLLDPTSLPLTQLWEDAARRGHRPSKSEIEDALKLVSWPEVEHRPGHLFLPHKGMGLEIGGFGKEFAVDQLKALAQQHGISAALIDLGRDLATLGSPPQVDYWIVGVENAQDLDTPLHRLALSGQALATSGNGRRFRLIGGERFGHIIDSRNGEPVRNEILTVTCLAPDCLTAGLLSTSACILGETSGLDLIESHFQVEGVLQTSKNFATSSNFFRLLI